MKTLIFVLLAFTGVSAGSSMPASVRTADPDAGLASAGSSSMLTAWMQLHLTAIRDCRIPSHHTRQLAYMGIALYESVVAGAPGYRSLAGQLNGYSHVPAPPAERDFCWQSSANAALAETFRYFYAENPRTVQRVDSMEQSYRNTLAHHGYSEAAVNAGALYGKQVALAVIDWSKTDGDDQANAPFELPRGPGLYEPTPPAFISPILPHMGSCRTFVKGDIDGTMPPPPLSFSEDPQSPFYKMADDVYRSSQKKDPGFTATALFWDDFPNGKTLTGGGHWESILKTIISQQNMSLIEGARVYAELFITMQDAAIGCFEAKYTYNLLRPVTYVQKYMHQSSWQPLIVTPPHPEYPAAHAVVSMSAATILTRILGDKIAFTDNTYAYRNYPAHHFNNFLEAGHEAGISRFYGGIHYMPSIEAGFKQGNQIAEHVYRGLEFKADNAMGSR
jgi:hypothetical protein